MVLMDMGRRIEYSHSSTSSFVGRRSVIKSPEEKRKMTIGGKSESRTIPDNFDSAKHL